MGSIESQHEHQLESIMNQQLWSLWRHYRRIFIETLQQPKEATARKFAEYFHLQG
jgi:hypothetical protein